MDLQSEQPDYYMLLGIRADASSTTIRAAFKQLALHTHPDINSAPEANERMSQLLRAYETLRDPARRRAYDARRAGRALQEEEWQPHSQAQPSTGHPGSTEVTPDARRDRMRHYAFPDISEQTQTPTRITLGAISYELTAAEAHTLVQQGLLRGRASGVSGTLELTAGKVAPHYCHRCQRQWLPAKVDARHPLRWERRCPACQAPDWAEYLLLRCVHCRAVFESEQIRDSLHTVGGQLCPPYALFPLCPYCGAARWCPSEDARVATLARGEPRKKGWFRRRA